MALPEVIEQERAKELQVEALEKQEILEYESHLAAASTRMQISEQNSLLLSQLITMDPTGIARRPPPAVLEQLQSLNSSHRLGHLLCRSRKPDFLLDIIQRQQQSSSQSMPWLADLVQNSEGSLSLLPVQCLCEFLLSTSAQAVDKQPRQQQLLAHLQTLLTDPDEDQQHAYEVLEYFLRRLSSQQSSSRLQAIAGLKLILESIPLDDENMEVDGDSEKYVSHFQKLKFKTSQILQSFTIQDFTKRHVDQPEVFTSFFLFIKWHGHIFIMHVCQETTRRMKSRFLRSIEPQFCEKLSLRHKILRDY